MQAETIAVIAFEDINPFQLSIPCTVFRENPGRVDAPHFNLLVCSAEKKTLRSNAGFSLNTSYSLRDVEQADIVYRAQLARPCGDSTGTVVELFAESASARCDGSRTLPGSLRIGGSGAIGWASGNDSLGMVRRFDATLPADHPPARCALCG